VKKLIFKAMTAVSLGCITTPALAQQASSRATAPAFQSEQAPVAAPTDFAGYSYGYVGAPVAYGMVPASDAAYAGYVDETAQPQPVPAPGSTQDNYDIAPATTKAGGACGVMNACCNDCCDPSPMPCLATASILPPPCRSAAWRRPTPIIRLVSAWARPMQSIVAPACSWLTRISRAKLTARCSPILR